MIPKCSLLAAVHQNPSIQPYFRLFSAILTCYSKKKTVFYTLLVVSLKMNHHREQQDVASSIITQKEKARF